MLQRFITKISQNVGPNLSFNHSISIMFVADCYL